MTDISFATEDVLSEVVLTKVIDSFNVFRIVNKLGRAGCGDIEKNITKYNNLAKIHHVVIMLDLDLKLNQDIYIDSIISKIKDKSDKLFFSVPVKEVESWLLADRQGLSSFMNISIGKFDMRPEELLDPKEKIIHLARSCKNRIAKTGIPPKAGVAAKMGISYNSILRSFVEDFWSIERAKENSPSLRKTLDMLENIM